MSNSPSVRLRLDLSRYDEAPFVSWLTRAEAEGVRFGTLASLCDSEPNRRALYDLNKACSADIPGRGAFYDFAAYVAQRLTRPADDPAGIVIARHGQDWIGMASSSHWPDRDLVFAEMTGVVRPWRRRGLAMALKVLALRYAMSKGVAAVATVHHAENVAAIALNRRFGFTDA